jgi:predicted nucleic acid-binding protein
VTPVFLDTVGLLATWDRADQWHAAASRAYTRLKTARTPVVTTTFVLAECGNAAARSPYRTDVADLRDRLESADRLIVPTEDDWSQAWAAYRNGEAAQAGLVDHLSFAVMRRLGLDEAFTNDRHFQAAGFRTLF